MFMLVVQKMVDILLLEELFLTTAYRIMATNVFSIPTMA